MKKQFGGKATKELIKQYTQSPNWKDGKFNNLMETTMEFPLHAIPKMLYKQFCETYNREPEQPIPIVRFNKEAFYASDARPKFIWYGHSALLMRWNHQTIFIDPMMGPDASPIAPFKTKRFSNDTLKLIDEFPKIDLVLLTHDHYDHLDLVSIQKLKTKASRWYVALGVDRHLVSWGIPSSHITTFDWWETCPFEGIQFTFTPSRHFSGRGLTDRFKSLWGGWVMQTEGHKIYWSGDGGYGDHFKEIGNQYGPFDFGFFECGQYNENWAQLHMFPEESVQAAIDTKTKVAMAVHWGAFALAQHSWTDPIEQFTKAAEKNAMEFSCPSPGQLFTYDQPIQEEWWLNHKHVK